MIVLKNAKARMAIRFIVPLALFPAVAAASAIAGGSAYVAGASVCALLAVLVFLAGFEQKKIGSRRLIITTVFVALSVAGRFLPLFKPVTALTMIAGIYLGRESGFAAGAFSALISDFYFGFGPWTPFQMLTWGLIGYIAGALGEKLKNSTPRQIVFGVIFRRADQFPAVHRALRRFERGVHTAHVPPVRRKAHAHKDKIRDMKNAFPKRKSVLFLRFQ